MNDARRKAIQEAQRILEGALAEEESYYEDMPESLQSSEKGETAQEDIQYLTDAIDALSNIS
jgi:hypothetical protein